MKIYTLYIFAAAVTVVGSGAIYYYAHTSVQNYTVMTQVLGGEGRIIAVHETGLVGNPGNNLTLRVNGGESLKLTVIPGPGWRFSSWGGDLRGSLNPSTVIVVKDMYITAILVPG